jgi:hypothetical protein
MGRKRKQGNIIPQKTNNLVKDSVENEENKHPVADSSRMIMISVSNESNEIHKDMLKQELKNELIQKLMQECEEKLKENIQKQHEKHQGNTKDLRRHRNN